MKLGLRPGFWRVGVTAASFSVWGTEQELKEQLMIYVMGKETVGKLSLTRLLSIESTMEVELRIPNIKLDSSSEDRWEN